MNFELDDEQRLLRDSVERLAAATGSLGEGYPSAPAGTWDRFAELGMLGLPFGQADGGYGGGPVETMIVAEALGRALNLEPYVASVVLAGSLLRFGASAAQLADLVPGIVDGTTRIAFAHQEPQARYDLDDVVLAAHRRDGRWILEGRKVAVGGGEAATMLLVSARTSGRRFERSGLTLFLVDAALAGVVRVAHACHDGGRGADFLLHDVAVDDACVVGPVGGAITIIERAADAALAASLAESTGLMETILALTIEHLRTRQQFGRRLGDFQALQHRAAEMLVATEQARSMTLLATAAAEATDPVERRKAISAARVVVSDALRFVGQQGVQLHGGLGITEEHAIGRCFRRATALESFLGDGEHHLGLFAETDGFLAPHEIPVAGHGADRHPEQQVAAR